MTNQTKSERLKVWLKEYLNEFKEYSGTAEELAQLANASPYLVKKVIGELESEGFLKAETKRGKGLIISLVENTQEEPEILDKEESNKAEKEEVEEMTEEKENLEKKDKGKKKASLQDQVLNSLLGKDVVIFLISGTRLEGKLLDFDNFTLSITAPKGKSLVYKHAIATILFE